MANGYYTHTSYPATNAQGSSSGLRAELDAVMAGFALLPNPLGLGQQGFSGGTWAAPTINNATYTGGTLDGVTIGGITPAPAAFTTLAASGAAALAGGGSLTGTFTALAGAILAAFAISGGTINGAAIGGTTPAAAAFTTLAASGAATFGAATFNSTVAVPAGAIELGSTTAAQTSFLDFHSSGQAQDYDARIAGSGGGGATGAGTLNYLAAAHAFSSRPTFAGNLAWDAGNLIGPFTTAGGTITGATAFTLRPTFAGNTAWDAGNLPQPFQKTGGTITGATAFSLRPTFNGATPWDSANFNAANFVQFGQTATFADSALGLRGGGGTGGTRMVFTFSGQGGQPSWLWGGNDGVNMLVWNPANFSVNFATSAGSAGSVAGVSSPATRTAVASQSGIGLELGPVVHPTTTALDAPSPWFAAGIRVTAWAGPSGDCAAGIALRCAQVVQA